ncbi:MAG TPA: glycoside hydrolase family 15 protein [Bryobacteraceae bacterium]|nr:glycoside hydrolase family 15 protein [Bryobacteraceae bacterium]
MHSQLIENYGIIGNMRSAALVGVDGAIDFYCFPSFDSPSVFGALLDAEKGGTFRIDPNMDEMRTKQLYLPDTNILVTRFLSEEGVAELTDFMPVESGNENGAYANQIIRNVRVIKGQVTFRLCCAPRFDYARSTHSACFEKNAICFHPEKQGMLSMALHGTVPLKIEGRDAIAEFTLSRGETASFAFGNVTKPGKEPKELLDHQMIEERFRQTSQYWRDWISQSRYTGRWREIVDRSALALKLLCSQEYGSLIAAPTFGLPEQRGGSRNWDYRFTWLRDSSFSLYAFMRLGFTGEARDFTKWLRNRLTDGLMHSKDDGPLQVMYRVDGSSDLEEQVLDHLAGYKGSRPVRIGNGAISQLQLDIYGELMDAIYLANKYVSGISHDGWKRMCRVLEWLQGNWQRPDEGIWEVRSGRRHFLHSRLMCWVAFDRAIRLAQKRSLVAPLGSWLKTRDAIHEDIFDNFWSEKLNCFVHEQGAETLDASMLLMPLMRFISPNDPRWMSTLAAIEENLTEDSLVYRYRGVADGLAGSDGSFTACSFWLVECLARSGQIEKARLLFEKMLGYANHLGLYSEELGSSGEHLGNFPQALTHLALISAATFLDRRLSGNRNETWQ